MKNGGGLLEMKKFFLIIFTDSSHDRQSTIDIKFKRHSLISS